jgi:anhydro-N-acetylmuramic acid kinase
MSFQKPFIFKATPTLPFTISVYLRAMVYHAIGTMSGSSMDGLDIAYCTFEENAGTWTYQINHAACIPFDEDWKNKLKNITSFSALELLRTHSDFGHWMGKAIHAFIEQNQLEHKVHFIASHGHTVFHEPQNNMTFQMGDGAAIAAINKLPVISDLRNMDIALGGQGAPIVPIGEKLLWRNIPFFLNIGGICNVTIHHNEQHIAFDICPANRVLNLLMHEVGKTFDNNGELAATGKIEPNLLQQLNALDYYKEKYPKSLSNEFGIEQVFPLIQQYSISTADKVHTMCAHIAYQVKASLQAFAKNETTQLFISGGGALNTFLIDLIRKELRSLQIEICIPEKTLIEYKEAMVMALIGVLRWREESNVLASVTGAIRNSVGGALWMGQE